MNFVVKIDVLEKVKKNVDENVVKHYVYASQIDKIELRAIECKPNLGDWLNPHWWAHFDVFGNGRVGSELVSIQFNPATGALIFE